MSTRVRVAWVHGERVFIGAEVHKQLRRMVMDTGAFHHPLVGPKHVDCRVMHTALGAGHGELKLIREARGTRKSEWRRLRAAWMMPRRTRTTAKQAADILARAQVQPMGDTVPAEPAQIHRAFRTADRAGRGARLAAMPIDEVF